MIFTKVALDDTAEIPAYVDQNNRWNGFACPYFRKKDVRLINDALKEFGSTEHLEYDANGDYFSCIDEDEGEIERFAGEDIDGMHLYPIGAGSWVWLESEEE